MLELGLAKYDLKNRFDPILREKRRRRMGELSPDQAIEVLSEAMIELIDENNKKISRDLDAILNRLRP